MFPHRMSSKVITSKLKVSQVQFGIVSMSGEWFPAGLTSLIDSFLNFYQIVPSVTDVSVLLMSLDESHHFHNSGKYLSSAWAAFRPSAVIELLCLCTGCLNPLG